MCVFGCMRVSRVSSFSCNMIGTRETDEVLSTIGWLRGISGALDLLFG